MAVSPITSVIETFGLFFKLFKVFRSQRPIQSASPVTKAFVLAETSVRLRAGNIFEVGFPGL